MNEHRTPPKIDTPLARGDSRPVRYELVDHDKYGSKFYVSLRSALRAFWLYDRMSRRSIGRLVRVDAPLGKRR